MAEFSHGETRSSGMGSATFSLGELQEELARFEAELRRAGLRESSIRTYVDRTSMFLRSLVGDYQPQGPRAF